MSNILDSGLTYIDCRRECSVGDAEFFPAVRTHAHCQGWSVYDYIAVTMSRVARQANLHTRAFTLQTKHHTFCNNTDRCIFKLDLVQQIYNRKIPFGKVDTIIIKIISSRNNHDGGNRGKGRSTYNNRIKLCGENHFSATNVNVTHK